MRRFPHSFGLLSIAASFLLLSMAQGDEEKVPLDKVPREVLDSVKARFPGAKLVSADKETDKGKVAYEIAIEYKQQKIEVMLTLEGKITQLEKQIAVKNLPKVVADAVAGKYPKAETKKVEEVIKVNGSRENLAFYEVVIVTAQGKRLEVSVGPQGKILNTEDQSKEKKK